MPHVEGESHLSFESLDLILLRTGLLFLFGGDQYKVQAARAFLERMYAFSRVEFSHFPNQKSFFKKTRNTNVFYTSSTLV